MNREDWLARLASKMGKRFEAEGYPLPAIRMACGFPSTGKRSKRIGECWTDSASEDGTHEIFIHPNMAEPHRVADILCHELIHTAVGIDAKHGPAFKKLANAMGLIGPMKATTAGPEFEAWTAPLIAKLGPYPHASLGGATTTTKTQTTRMIKLVCSECGYQLRTTRKWIEIGVPTCFCGTEFTES